MIAIDLFTQILRYFVWTVMAFLFVAVSGAFVWSALYRWRKERQRRNRWKNHPSPYDQDTALGIHDMYPRSNVTVPDRIPEGWAKEWQ